MTDIYKSYAFVEYFDLEDAKKALDALNKGEIKLREEALSGNYSTKTEDKNTNFNYENNLSYNHGVNIFNKYELFRQRTKAKNGKNI